MSVLQSNSRSLDTDVGGRSGSVDPKVINVVAMVGRDKWRDIGRLLEFTEDELMDYDHTNKTFVEKLRGILYDWTRKHETVTTEQLLAVCDEVGIGGIVRRQTTASRKRLRRSTDDAQG